MTRVYLGRLNSAVRERDVEKFFRDYGKLREVTLKGSFGFVEFDDSRDAEDAVYDLNNKELCGDRIIVEFARNRRDAAGGRDSQYRSSYRSNSGGRLFGSRGAAPIRTEYRIYIENLSSRMSWQDLKDHIRNKVDVEVTYADAHKQSVGQAIVEFDNRDDMKRTIRKLDGADINGKKIRISKDSHDSRSSRRSRSPKRHRSRSPSPRRHRSRSRSNSPRRSRSESSNDRRSKSQSPEDKDRNDDDQEEKAED